MDKFMQILCDETGQGMVEYGLILGLVVLVAVGTVITIGNGVNGFFTATQPELAKAIP